LIIDDNDWLVIEAYMSDFHPDSRWCILESIRLDHAKIIELSDRIATEMIVSAYAWDIAMRQAINNARRLTDSDGREGA